VWGRRRRNPLSGKGCGAYHVWMPDDIATRLAGTYAVPLTFTVGLEANHWCVRAWYHGHTVHDALHPVLVAEYTLRHDQAPPHALWGELYRGVAIAIEDLAAGTNVNAYVE